MTCREQIYRCRQKTIEQKRKKKAETAELGLSFKARKKTPCHAFGQKEEGEVKRMRAQDKKKKREDRRAGGVKILEERGRGFRSSEF